VDLKKLIMPVSPAHAETFATYGALGQEMWGGCMLLCKLMMQLGHTPVASEDLAGLNMRK
jgi:hypothetical protein